MIYSLFQFSEKKKNSAKVLTSSITSVSDVSPQKFVSAQIKEHFYQVSCFYPNLKCFSATSSQNGIRDFQNSPPFERSACFYVTINVNFERFQFLNYETDFLENGNLSLKTGVASFS